MGNLSEKFANPALFIAFLIAFFVTAAIHLILSFVGEQKIRLIFKPFPVALLGGLCLAYSLDLLLPSLAFFLAAFGDLIYIKKNNFTRAVAPVIFFAGHCCGIAYIHNLSNEPWTTLVAFALLGMLFCIHLSFYIPIDKFRKVSFRFVSCLYFASITCRLLCFIFVLRFSPYYWIGLLGALVFFISDSLIAVHSYIKKLPRRNFLVMGTYFLANAMLCLAYLLPLILG